MKTEHTLIRTACARFTRANHGATKLRAQNAISLALALGLSVGCSANHQLKPSAEVQPSPPAPEAKPAVPAEQTADAKLQEARQALRGEPKDAARAKKLLLEIVEHDKDTLEPTELCHAYVYLGYIEDRAGHGTEPSPGITRPSQSRRRTGGSGNARATA